jgi:hypothetical protein
MSRKSSSCFSSRSGSSLTEYDSEYESQEGADHANRTYGHDLGPYQCGNCGLWHLSPKNRQTPSTRCPSCTGRDGQNKALYSSEEIAERRAYILYQEQGIGLSVYECPYYHGWHLTKG